MLGVRYRLNKARVHGARSILLSRAARASFRAITAQAAGEVEFAASLRGKAKAYREAVDLLGALEDDRALPPRSREATRVEQTAAKSGP